MNANPMRVAINCRSFMNRQYTGIGRYASRLVHGLSDIDPRHQYLLYAPKGFFNTKRILPRIKAGNFHLKIDRFKKGVRRTVGPVDIFHSPSPDIFDAPEAKMVVTIHDLVYKAFPEGHTARTLELTDAQMRFLTPLAGRFICCSRNTAADLKRFFGVPDQKIRVIYSGVDTTQFYRMTDAERRAAEPELKKRGLLRNYVLFVGTLEPRKNLKNLMKAFALMKSRHAYAGDLVICGMSGWDSEDLRRLAVDLNIKDALHFLGFIDDGTLRVLYNFSDCFVFPSFYEGFGYPIVEAFNCGAPVVTSIFASCPEIAGDAALTVDTREPELIAQAAMNIIGDPGLRQRFIEKGLERARLFDVRLTAAQTLEVYQELYES